MVLNLIRKIFGSENNRLLNQIYKIVHTINSLEENFIKLSDEEIKLKTEEFKSRISKGETLDDLLPEAFALVREAAKRVLGQRHYDVQLIGGIALHRGMIAEMRTGEGKTLVATLAAYLNALKGEGVHVVTVNDYLAKRDSSWMGKVYNFLGLSVGCILGNLNEEERKQAYNADITYGTNNEFGFDYLRDNMKYNTESIVQRKLSYAIIDEVDSILIDEARTPLIISGPTDIKTDLYVKINRLPSSLKPEHYEVDEKSRTVTLTDEGNSYVEEWLSKHNIMHGSLYDITNMNILHHVNQAIKAYLLFEKDVDYIVKNNQVMIIDEFTGRIMEGRRYSEGLHQALEAKENVEIKNENQTLASITFQNYFRLYEKLSGMTGTAMTEEAEFREIYRLRVLEIPTNLPVKRIDEDDEIYRTAKEKYDAIVKLIKERHAVGQPILVGTTSIEKSEFISSRLKKEKIPHQILNAKYHEQEAQIIAQAGRKNAVMIATNMAGRGTDIILGGNLEMRIQEAIKGIESQEEKDKIIAKLTEEYNKEKQEVMELGGLLVIGTERHESRRIDNQLRGRSGRQGDPGRTKFFLSLEDDLMRIFGSDRLSSTMQKLGMNEGDAIVHPWVTKALMKAQHKVEVRNYDIRKNLLKYDDVMNEQRMIIYEQRREIITSDDVSDIIKNMINETVENIVAKYISDKMIVEQWDFEGLVHELEKIFGSPFEYGSLKELDVLTKDVVYKSMLEHAYKLYDQKEQEYNSEIMRFGEKRFLILSIDHLWKDHLLTLDHLRHSIGLRAYGQKDPLLEYKREAFNLFSNMLDQLNLVVVGRIMHMEISVMDPVMQEANMRDLKTNVNNSQSGDKLKKIGRNEQCPCGSGRKYKHCCGKIA